MVLSGGTFGAGGSSSGMGGVSLSAYAVGHSFNPKRSGGWAVDAGYTHGIQKTDSFLIGLSFLETFRLTKAPPETRWRTFYPFAAVGITGFAPAGQAVHYGGGVLWKYRGSVEDFQALRVEYREYLFPTNLERVPTLRISHEWGSALE